jgi:phosphonate transport system substrate-binding protein
MLIPADGGTEDGTKADFQPVFSAVTRTTGLQFEIRVGQSYSSVIEGMANAQVDIGFFGPVSYLQARERGGAELLAVAVEKGQSVYYSGVFAKAGLGLAKPADLKGAGRSIALGDVNSTSSFAYPLAMLIAAGIDPVKDFGRIIMAGSHANSLKALDEGKVDVCCASFDSFEKAVNQKAIDPAKFVVLGKSEPIPYPPLAMHPKLPAATKQKLKQAFATVHEAPGVTKEMIRGYGGKKVDRYDTTVAEEVFTASGAKLNAVNDALKAEILKKAGAGK